MEYVKSSGGGGRVIVTKLHMVEGEGVKNRPIKCHLLFECPLIEKTSIAATATINQKKQDYFVHENILFTLYERSSF